ncbi:MAG: polysaccharide deacetylase family protein [Chitinophagia bacterium]|jgi:peptidoglycan/xylan/chitin deacetylase (PgdA/CDA1 family)
MYLVKTPGWLQKIYSQLYWRMPNTERNLYLTFDDGPHPLATTFVLDQLDKYQAAGSFFCVGENAQKHPELLNRIQQQGHLLGNHTMHHVNGWKVSDELYLQDIEAAAAWLPTGWFRPPYGRIRFRQQKLLQSRMPECKVMMWDVLSGDFDQQLTGQQCAANVIRNAGAGSVVVFHDSTKAWDRLQVALPLVLEHFSKEGYQMKALPPAAKMNS